MQCFRIAHVRQLGAPILASRNDGLRRVLRSRPAQQCRRQFGIEVIPTVLTPPAVFGGLIITLWAYKCLVMVMLQNKIIYMPGVPPFSRAEKVADYEKQCAPVHWEEHSIKSIDGTSIKLLEGKSPAGSHHCGEKKVVVLYLQGNASSLPPRLPYLSNVLKALSAMQLDSMTHLPEFSIVALSYRGYWKSRGRPSQAGIELDAQAALQWIFDNHTLEHTKVVLWGQSIGAGVATTALAQLSKSTNNRRHISAIRGLLLETPFIDLASMLVALYPQRFLPYRYLTPFLWSTWNSKIALERISHAGPWQLRVLLLEAEKDEIVPAGHAEVLEGVLRSGGIAVERKIVGGALHTDVLARSQGRMFIARFLHGLSADTD